MKINKTIPLLVSIALFTACGGGTSDTSPQAIISSITDGYKIVAGKTLDLDGSSSSDNGSITSYKWTVDGNIVSLESKKTIDIDDLSLGEHEVCLEVIDDESKSKKECRTIEVIESQLDNPTAVINGYSASKTDCPIILDASESSADGSADIVKYEWFKDGEAFGTNSASQEFASDTTGTYNISVKVTDDEGNFATEDTTITVAEHSNPTVKLEILTNRQETVFIDETTTDKTWDITSDTEVIPSEGNYVFISVNGSHDDCNATDDNLTYIWDARIYKIEDGQESTASGTRRNHCFTQKPGLEKIHRDFNTTGNSYPSFGAVLEDDTADYTGVSAVNFRDNSIYETAKYIYPYPYDTAHIDGNGNAIDLAPAKETSHPYIYIELCKGDTMDYNRLEITLKVKDNLHDKEINIKKTIKIKAGVYE